MKTITYLLTIALTLSTFNLFAQTQKVNTDESTIHWLGKKIGGQHDGFINLKSGELTLKEGNISSGSFTIDMTSITNEDLGSDEYKQKLVGHLMSDDFFGVEKFPTAKLEINKAGAFINGTATVNGDLTIKGKTAPIRFDVVQADGAYTTSLAIDRSKFDVRYGSNSFFDNLGDKAIDDIFTLDITLVVE